MAEPKPQTDTALPRTLLAAILGIAGVAGLILTLTRDPAPTSVPGNQQTVSAFGASPSAPAEAGVITRTVVPADRPAASAADSADTLEPALINLNTALPEALQLLPGIGPAKASAIVQDRVENGPFKTVDDIDRVPGIGPKTLERLRPLVSVSD